MDLRSPARSGRFAYDLQAHIATHAPFLTVYPSSDSDVFSDSEEEELYEPITPPPNFTIDSPPTDDTPFQPLNPAGRGLASGKIGIFSSSGLEMAGVWANCLDETRTQRRNYGERSSTSKDNTLTKNNPQLRISSPLIAIALIAMVWPPSTRGCF